MPLLYDIIFVTLRFSHSFSTKCTGYNTKQYQPYWCSYAFKSGGNQYTSYCNQYTSYRNPVTVTKLYSNNDNIVESNNLRPEFAQVGETLLDIRSGDLPVFTRPTTTLPDRTDRDTWLIIKNIWQLHDKRIKMCD